MPFFQNSVISKYLKNTDKQVVTAAYAKFVEHFHNPILQENIRNSKEEQYQEGFLTDLFVEVLGYTKNPRSNFNLTTEYKNIKDGKKADGAIIINDAVKAVIELKGTETTDLSKVENQAFGYKNNQPECIYVITSNFEKLRFYIDNAIEHIEFNLFTLTEKEFELLYLLLAFVNIEKGIPKKIKDESLSTEDLITKKLYNDYSLFKRELHQNLVGLNPQYDPLTLFKNSQKLLDRFLFLFFAEDRQLLPPNSVRLILNDWKDLIDRDEYKPLYGRFKKYFGYLNTGFKGKRYDVFAYNGGLFKPDEILDALLIDDDLLYKHTGKLAVYDFDSEVDVNILGHIFENSLNELDEIKAQLEGKEIDKSKTKRKKDGVFYTPKYITKYIVDNTVGKLCTEKKTDLQINEEEYISNKKIQKQTKQALADKLTAYRNWLLQLKICDPACGSGAFLNQALDFLINEHRYIDELQAKLFGASLVLSDFDNSILENNLFGVDLNEESVEIAKLSLWLRTARPNRKLNDLNNNIKCGNSLIDDPAVAGEKAFNWFLEFPQVFPHYRKPKSKPIDYVKIREKVIESEALNYPDQGDNDYDDDIEEPAFSYKPGSKGFVKHGFDVVIGNPPYLVIKGGRWINGFEYNNNVIEFIRNKFKTAEQQINTYVLFLELAKYLVKQNGIISQITPNTFFANEYSKRIRNFLIENANLLEIKNTGLVFEDASVETAITVYKNNRYEGKTLIINNENQFEINFIELKGLTYDDKYLINLSKDSLGLLKRLSNNDKIQSIAKVWRGLTTGDDEKFLSGSKLSEIYKPILTGSEIQRYYHNNIVKYVYYDQKLLDRARDERIFILKEKLISKFVGNRLSFCYDNEQNYVINTACSFELLDNDFSIKYLLCLLNSRLLDYYFQMIFSDSRTTFPIMKSGSIEQLPIIKIDMANQSSFIQKADLMLSLNKDLQLLAQKFQRNLQREFTLEDLPGKLQNWYLLGYPDFIKELEKKKIKLTLSKKAEWEEYFMQESKKALELKTQIETTDKEIDQMVYELYQLTPEEIKIVELKK